MKTKYGYIQFSKLALALFIIIWYITAFYGYGYTWKNKEGFAELLLFVGGPVGGGIITYLINSAVEKYSTKRYGGEEDANTVI